MSHSRSTERTYPNAPLRSNRTMLNPHLERRAYQGIQTSRKRLKQYETIFYQNRGRVRHPLPLRLGCSTTPLLQLSSLKLEPHQAFEAVALSCSAQNVPSELILAPVPRPAGFGPLFARRASSPSPWMTRLFACHRGGRASLQISWSFTSRLGDADCRESRLQ